MVWRLSLLVADEPRRPATVASAAATGGTLRRPPPPRPTPTPPPPARAPPAPPRPPPAPPPAPRPARRPPPPPPTHPPRRGPPRGRARRGGPAQRGRGGRPRAGPGRRPPRPAPPPRGRRPPAVPRHRLRALDHVVAVQRADRDELDALEADVRSELADLPHGIVERLLGVADEVHLVDGHDHVANPQQRGDRGVAAALLGQPRAGVDEQQREVRGGGAGDHVARVLLVAGAVGEDEAPARRRERAVGDVDRDALLALGAQAVGEQREVEPVDAALLDVRELVGEHGLGVIEQAADQRRLAVVDAAGGGEAQEVH